MVLQYVYVCHCHCIVQSCFTNNHEHEKVRTHICHLKITIKALIQVYALLYKVRTRTNIPYYIFDKYKNQPVNDILRMRQISQLSKLLFNVGCHICLSSVYATW